MRGEAKDRVASRQSLVQGRHGDNAQDAETLIVNAREASDFLEVLATISRLREAQGIQSAAVGTIPAPISDPFAAIMASLPSDSPAELVYNIGPQEWRLQLRVSFTDPVRYARLGPAVSEIAAAAERTLRQVCHPMAHIPGSRPSALYTTICERSSDIIVIVDPREGWTTLSESFHSILGYDRQALPPGGPLHLIHPDDRAEALSTFIIACSGRRAPHVENLRVRAIDGRWLTMEIRARGVAMDDRRFVVVYNARDVTETRDAQRRVRVENARLTHVASAVSEGVLVLDQEGRIVVLNDVGRRLLCLDRYDNEATDDIDALLSAIQPLILDNSIDIDRLGAIIVGNRAVAGQRVEFADGRILEFDIVPLSCDTIRSGSFIRILDQTARITTLRCIDESAAVSSAYGMESAQSDAEVNIAAGARALNNEFVRAIAHELRGPLSSVVAFSGLLNESRAGNLSDDQHGHLEVIERNSHRLLRFIDDVLLLSRLEARTLYPRYAPVRLRDILGAAIVEYEPQAASIGVEICRDVVHGPDLIADEAWLYQVIINVLSNALHFTPRGGRITVRSRAVRGLPGIAVDHWIVDVVDTGIGIPAPDVSRLFDVFYRGSNVTLTLGRDIPSGTGLGLVICRAIVEIHGGAIQVASTEGIGTTVTLTLPVRPERISEVDRESAARR